MSEENVEIVQTLIPPPEVDVASLIRDDSLFEQARAAFEPFVDPDVEAVAMLRFSAKEPILHLVRIIRRWSGLPVQVGGQRPVIPVQSHHRGSGAFSIAARAAR